MQLRTRFLSSTGHIVKVFLIPNLLIALPAHSKGPKTEEFFLAKGEQIEIARPDLNSFSVGNKEVLKSKYYAAKGQILVKGHSLGFSDLVVWDKQGQKSSYHFYVVSKKEQLTNFQLANDFKSLGLEVKALAFQLLVSGELKSLEDLKLFNMYLERNKERVVNMVHLSQSLKNEIIADIYLALSQESLSLICTGVGTKIECVYEGLDVDSPLTKKVGKKFAVNFTPRKNQYAGANFKIELKVFRTDQGHLRDMGLGLDRLSSKIGTLLNSNERALVESNNLLFSEKELESRIITSPAILTSMDVPGEIQLGAEIPVVNQNQYGAQSTTWKFAGLKLNTLLSLVNTRVKLTMESELTHPVENLIRGSKSKTVFFPKLGQYIQAFQVRYDLRSASGKKVPGIGEIPILGALFSSSSKSSSAQWLVGYVKIVREP